MAKPPNPISPELWAAEIVRVMKGKSIFESMALGQPRLDPNDVWAPTQEAYREAHAWACLLGVKVTRPQGRSPLRDCFVLSNGRSVPTMIGVCSPGELIDAVKKFAADSSEPTPDGA